ncbi:MAG: PAS domain S-box protein [Acidobacteriota bacterium]|nr:PAS domain S-box protein [Acidobacteriota bacterium]
MRSVSPERQIEAVCLLARYLCQDHTTSDTWLEAARLAAVAAGADMSVVLECLPGDREFAVRSAYGWTDAPGTSAYSGLRSVAARALESPTGPLVVADVAGAGHEPAAALVQGVRAACAAVVGEPDAPFGALLVYSREPGTFSDTTAASVESLAAVLGLAVRRAQRAAELEREREERVRLAALVEGTDDAIVSATLDGTILSWNPGAERLYGYAADEIVGANVSILVPTEHDADRRHLMERVRLGQRIPAFDAEHRRKDGSLVTVSLSLSPVRDQGGVVTAFAGIAHDVTETRRFESELRQLAKMEAVGRLAGGLAHDFNNMLTVIDGYSQLLLMKLPADSAERGLVEEIHKAGERAADLARQLMVFSRKSMVEPTVLNLSDVVQSDVEMLKRVIGEDITIETHLATDLDHVMVDRAQFDQVLVNLVINARDALPDGGRITIETSNVDVAPGSGLGPRDVAAGQYVRLSVTDTGMGMDPATLERIFEPFFTTKGSGTGLGLAMLQTFVMQSGGQVTVDSQPDHGTCFAIYLPTVALPVVAASGSAVTETPSGSETILVVEDDDAVRVFTEAVLKAAGYEVLGASNGADALALAHATTRPIDMLMSDVVMPVLGGHALAAQFAVPHPEAKVLFTSGYTPETVTRRGISIPAGQFLQKPYSPAALCRKVRQILGAED